MNGNDILDALCDGWKEVSKSYQANACILATRAGIEALGYFDIKAQAVPCELVVANPKWSVGITPDGAADDPRFTIRGGYPAHLVILLEQTILIDLSLAQVNRPQHDIVLGPRYARVDDTFLQGVHYSVGSVAGCEIRYRARPDIGNIHTRTSDWKNHRHASGPLIRFMRERLALT